jgi:hypothetical protein
VESNGLLCDCIDEEWVIGRKKVVGWEAQLVNVETIRRWRKRPKRRGKYGVVMCFVDVFVWVRSAGSQETRPMWFEDVMCHIVILRMKRRKETM